MVVPGFHYFVAWRYLMTRPRRVSVPTFTVVTVLLVMSIAVAALGRYVFPVPPKFGLLPLGTPAHLIRAAGVVFLAMAGATIAGGLCAHVGRNPRRLFVPLSAPLALMAGAVAVIGLRGSSYQPTLALACAALVPSIVIYVLRAPAVERALVSLLVVLFGGAGAACLLLGSRAEHMIILDNRWVLASFGLVLLGVLLTISLWLTYVNRRPRSVSVLLAGLAPLAIGAGALCASLAHPTVDLFRPELDLDVLHLLDRIRKLGFAFMAIGAVAGALTVPKRMHRISVWRRLPRVAVGIAWGALVVSSAGLAAVILVQVSVASFTIAPTQLQLASVALVVLAELAIVLGIIRYYFTFFTTVSMTGVAIGSMALVIVLSVMSGFETDLREKILGSNAHVLVTKEDGEFTEYEKVEELVESLPQVVAVTPYFISEVVIAANNNYANVLIKGIDPATVGKVTDLAKDIKQERGLDALWPLAPDGTIVGKPPAVDDGRDPDAPYEPDPDAIDPAPPDMRVRGTDPEDFSSGPDSQKPKKLGENVRIDAGGGRLYEPKVDDDGPYEPPVDVDDDDDGPYEPPVDVDDVDVDDDEPYEPSVDDDEPYEPSVDDDDDDELEGAIFDLPERSPAISPRVASLSGVLVGKELVKQIHLYVGQEVRMVSPLSDPTNPGGAPIPYTRNYRVAGTFYTGMYEYDLKFVYVDLESLQEFLDLGDQVNGIEIRLSDPDATSSVVNKLNKQLGPGYRVQDWKEINRGLFSALKLEKIAMFLVLAIIILVASFSIIGNLIMVVVEKAKEIALLKTLGASNTGIMGVFVTQGFFIGLVGTMVGVAHGLVACYLGTVFGLPLDPDVYYIDRLPIHVEGAAVLAVAAAGVLISIVATIYPAYVGGRVQPIEGLRYE